MVLVATFALVVLLVRRPGHWWGDDWALYVRQAEGIVGFRAREVIADNRFTVETSGLPEFSPPVYPWGYSLLLAPFVAVLGTDLDRLVVAQAAFFCWFLGVWWVLARRRVGPMLSFLGLLVLALSPQFVRWAELIQSELAFMAVAITALVVLDRSTVRRAWADTGAPWWPLIAVGVLGAAAFEVRREGLAVMAAIGAAQVVALWPRIERWWERGAAIVPDRAAARSAVWPVVRLATPWITALAIVLALQVLLPATLVPGYEGNGLHNLVRFAPDHLGHVMESVGLQRPGAPAATVLGQEWAGALAALAFVVLTMAGVVLGFVGRARRPALHLPVLAFTVVALTIGGSFRMPGSRYVAVIGPMALLLCLVAIDHLRAVSVSTRRTVPCVERSREPSAAPRPATPMPGGGASSNGDRQRRFVAPAVTVAAVVLLGALVVANAVRVADLVTDARRFAADGEVVWGPDHPGALKMFEAVVEVTEPDAVIGFFKARAMTQRTDRRAVQVDEWHPVERTRDVLTHVVIRTSPDDLPVLDTLFPPSPDTAHPEIAHPEILWSSPHFTLIHLGF